MTRESQLADFNGCPVEVVSLDFYEGRWLGPTVVLVRFVSDMCARKYNGGEPYARAKAADLVPVGALAKAILREAQS